MTIKDGNFRNQETPSLIGIEYECCCFAQSQPIDTASVKTGVRLFPGDDTARTFIKCNLVNC